MIIISIIVLAHANMCYYHFNALYKGCRGLLRVVQGKNLVLKNNSSGPSFSITKMGLTDRWGLKYLLVDNRVGNFKIKS